MICEHFLPIQNVTFFFKVQGVQGDNEQSAKSLNIYILIFIICADRKLSYINENDIYDA